MGLCMFTKFNYESSLTEMAGFDVFFDGTLNKL